MANNAERHEQLMQQMAALTASLGGLTNLNPLLAQQQQTNAELSSLSTHLGGVAARIDALVAAGGATPPGGAPCARRQPNTCTAVTNFRRLSST